MKKHIPLLYAILVLLTSSIVFYKCKKVEDQFSLQNGNSNLDLGLFEKNAIASNLFSSLVSYNSAYDVLVFNNFNDIKLLEDALDDYDNNYPFDGGMTTSFFAVLDSIPLYGYNYEDDELELEEEEERDEDDNEDGDDKSASVSTTGKVAPNAVKATTTGLVNLNRLQTNLLLAYPLSDTLLNKIIALNEGLTEKLPKKFIKRVIKPNAPYSYTVRTNIENANINNGVKNKLIKADEDATLVPDFAYNDFLNTFPMFNSLFKELEQVEKIQLESGMDPANPLFDNHFVSDEFLRLILNTSKEIYVNGYLIKLYNDCAWAIFKENLSEAYADMAKLDGNGVVTTPTLLETPQGLSLTTMNQYVPMNYALVNPSYIELTNGGKLTPPTIQFVENNPQKRDQCAPSLFSQIRDTANNLLIHFNSFTDLNYQGGTFYQYWNFGDGTGSFITDPNHLYTTAGVYTVKLTTFNDNCGCWDVEEREIGVGLGDKACGIYLTNATASLINITSSSNEYSFSFDIENVGPDPIANIEIDFKDLSNNLIIPQTSIIGSSVSFTHTFSQLLMSGTVTYFPSLTITTVGTCSSEELPFGGIDVTYPQQGCCDRKDVYKDTVLFAFGSNNYKLRMRDKIQGNSIFVFFGTRVRAAHTFYRLKSNGGWKQQKADFTSVSVTGKYNEVSSGVCGTQKTISGTLARPNFKEENNKKKIRLNFQMPGKFGMSLPDMITVTHRVILNGNTQMFLIPFGDC